MPSEPGSGMFPAGYGHMRASTADRERTIDVLKAAFAEGRLTQDECEERAAQAFISRTYAELAPPESRPVNRLAIASLMIALMPVIPVLAVLTGLIALGQIHERGERGAGVATAGIVIGALVSLFFAFYVLRS
jgi:uncharacterized membrane protein